MEERINWLVKICRAVFQNVLKSVNEDADTMPDSLVNGAEGSETRVGGAGR